MCRGDIAGRNRTCTCTTSEKNGPLQRKTAIWVIFSKVVFFALLNGSWFQLHAREILGSYEIALLSKFRGKVGYVQDFDQKRRSAACVRPVVSRACSRSRGRLFKLLSVQKDLSQDMGRRCLSCLRRRILSPLCTDTLFALWTGPRRVAPLAVALLRHR